MNISNGMSPQSLLEAVAQEDVYGFNNVFSQLLEKESVIQCIELPRTALNQYLNCGKSPNSLYILMQVIDNLWQKRLAFNNDSINELWRQLEEAKCKSTICRAFAGRIYSLMRSDFREAPLGEEVFSSDSASVENMVTDGGISGDWFLRQCELFLGYWS